MSMSGRWEDRIACHIKRLASAVFHWVQLKLTPFLYPLMRCSGLHCGLNDPRSIRFNRVSASYQYTGALP